MRERIDMTKVIGVVSAKGGVGKTTTVANLGVIAAAEFGRKVLAVDANISAPNLGMYLGIINPPVTLHDVLQEKFSIRRSIYTHSTGLHVLPASFSEGPTDQKELRRKIESVFHDYDIIFLDSPPGMSDEVIAAMKASDEIILITNPESPIVTTTLKNIKLAGEMKVSVAGIVLNRMCEREYEMSPSEVGDCLGVPVIATIPEDPRIPEAVSRAMPVAQCFPDSGSSEEFRALAAYLLGEEHVPGFFVRIKKLFDSVKNFFR
ncbi:MAG: P-loop NTPase [Euryarchaeota archaeon]|nr:P-loop NTPase [Euryarchaeota archaeon]